MEKDVKKADYVLQRKAIHLREGRIVFINDEKYQAIRLPEGHNCSSPCQCCKLQDDCKGDILRLCWKLETNVNDMRWYLKHIE